MQKSKMQEIESERTEAPGGSFGRRSFIRGMAAGGAALMLGVPIVGASHTPGHHALSLNTTTTFTEMNRGYADPRLSGGDLFADDYYERSAQYLLKYEPYDEVDPFAFASTKTRPVKDLRSRAWVGRRFTAKGTKPRQVRITIDGRFSVGAETGTNDLATASVRVKLYDYTTGTFLRDRAIKEIRSENGANNREFGAYRKIFEPVLRPDHSYRVFVETRTRSARTLSYSAGNSQHSCDASALGEIKRIRVAPLSG